MRLRRPIILLAALAGVGALLVGVLLGTKAKASDVETTIGRGEAVAHDVRAWRDAHGGTWPATVEETGRTMPSTATRNAFNAGRLSQRLLVLK